VISYGAPVAAIVSTTKIFFGWRFKPDYVMVAKGYRMKAAISRKEGNLVTPDNNASRHKAIPAK